MIADLIQSSENRFDRIGARIHDVSHPVWRDELEIIISRAGQRVAYIVLPKPESAKDVATQITALDELKSRYAITREIPVHVLIETPGALHEAWDIARLPHVEVLDFGLMDFVSAHHGAIPAAAMRSPGQFSHALVVRAKCAIAAAALGNGVVPSHNVTTEIRDANVVREDARRARQELGFLRMWSIHPAQILPIVEAMRPDFTEVNEASKLLAAAQVRPGGLSSRKASCMTALPTAITGNSCNAHKRRECTFQPKPASVFSEPELPELLPMDDANETNGN